MEQKEYSVDDIDSAVPDIDMDTDSTATTQESIDPMQFTPDNTLDEDSNQSTDNFVGFGEGSDMPPMLNLQTAGLSRSPRTTKLKRPWYKCNLISKLFCILTMTTTLQLTPTLSDVYTGAENMVFSAVHSYHATNQLFDDTLNSLHPMTLATENEDNEAYTFKQMLKQPDAAEFIKAMMKGAGDHESKNHWTVVPRSEKHQV